MSCAIERFSSALDDTCPCERLQSISHWDKARERIVVALCRGLFDAIECQGAASNDRHDAERIARVMLTEKRGVQVQLDAVRTERDEFDLCIVERDLFETGASLREHVHVERSPSVAAPIAQDAQEKQEQVDEVEIEG